MIKLIDLCSIQGTIDADKIKAAGIDGAYVKASQYSSTWDHRFDGYISELTRVGISCGAYHFCSQQTDPVKQMKFFKLASTCYGSSTMIGTLPPLLDWEFCHALDPKVCVDWLTTAAAEVTNLWGREPVIYTYPNYSSVHQPHLGNSTLGRYKLFLAAYKSVNGVLVPWEPEDGQTPETALGPVYAPPKPWSKVTLWQYSGNKGQRVPGIAGDVDRSCFLGPGAEWDELRMIKRPAMTLEFTIKEDVFTKD